MLSFAAVILFISLTTACTVTIPPTTQLPETKPPSQPPPEDSPNGNPPYSANPLRGVRMHSDVVFRRNIDKTIKNVPPNEKPGLRRVRNVPTAYWLDTKEKVGSGNGMIQTADDVFRAALPGKQMVTLIVYNLPNRDCAALASNGRICCSYNSDGTCNYTDGTNNCEGGIEEYQEDFILPLATTVQQYCNKVPMVLVIEPDSLPNLVTNKQRASCGNSATQYAYRTGIKFAVERLSAACGKAVIYVDGAHGGWLGWEDNSEGFVQEIQQMGIAGKIRGFALNVANYQPLGMLCPTVGMCLPNSNGGHQCCNYDSCGLTKEYNPGFTELNYAMVLKEKFGRSMPMFNPHFIIDTGRNGVAGIRDKCANWCNIRGAGFGRLPTTETGYEMIDAFMWLKTPGESDGCTELLPSGNKCARFDGMCASVDSIGSTQGEPRVPEAGNWFEYQIRMLARNAKFQ